MNSEEPSDLFKQKYFDGLEEQVKLYRTIKEQEQEITNLSDIVRDQYARIAGLHHVIRILLANSRNKNISLIPESELYAVINDVLVNNQLPAISLEKKLERRESVQSDKIESSGSPIDISQLVSDSYPEPAKQTCSKCHTSNSSRWVKSANEILCGDCSQQTLETPYLKPKSKREITKPSSNNRICQSCGADKTSKWYLNQDVKGTYLCNACYRRRNTKKKNEALMRAQAVAQQAPNRNAEVQQQVNEVIGIMHTNIDKVVQRGEKLEKLEAQTQELQNGALSFKKSSVQVKNEMWWKNMKLMAIIGGVAGVIIVIAVVSALNVQDANGVAQPIYDVIFIQDGTKVVAAAGQELLIYNAAEGNLIKALKAHRDSVICLSPLLGDGFASGGADKQVNLWTADGIQIGQICKKDGWIWSCKASPTSPFVVVGSADGTISMYQVVFNTVHGFYEDKYAYRQNLTDVVIQNLSTAHCARIKCRDYIKKIALYKECLAVQIPDRVVVYELFHDEQGDMHYRIKEKIQKDLECDMLVVASHNILLCNDNKLQMYSMSGEHEHEWTFESTIKFIRVLGGPKRKEGVLLGLKSGEVLQLFINNPFPITLVKHSHPVNCADINLSKKKLAIVDDQNTCLVFDLATKDILYQEQNVSSLAWNMELEDSVCISGNGELQIKVNSFLSHQQRLEGLAIGFKGAKVFTLNNNSMAAIDIPLSIQMNRFIEDADFQSAYQIACLGVPESDWRKLAIQAMEKLDMEISKKSFIRIKEYKYLDAIRIIEKMKSEGRKETDLFLAEVAAYFENYHEAARLFKRSGNPQRAIEMFTQLNMWENATQIAEESHENTQDILKRKAQIQEDHHDTLAAAMTYEQVGDYAHAIELLGVGGWTDKLIEVVRKLPANETDLLTKCVGIFKKKNNTAYAIETLKKSGDILSLLGIYISSQQWEEVFKIGETNPEFNEQTYLPYGNWLAMNDRFEEAQVYYTKAGRADEAIRVLRLLSDNAIIQHRYKDAAYYYWSLAKETLNFMNKRFGISQRDHNINSPKAWKLYYELAEVYYAYNQIYTYIEDPFTFSSPESLLNSSKFVLNYILNKPAVPGISKNYTLYCMAKISFKLGCYKLSRFAFEKLMAMKLPLNWQETVDLATLSVRAMPVTDKDDFLPICYNCGTTNLLFNPKSASCANCREPAVHSFYSFENLPLTRFVPHPDISEEDCLKYIQTDPPISKPGGDLFNSQLLGISQEHSEYKPTEYSKEQLINLDPQEVFTRTLGQKEYYRLCPSDIHIIMCDSCQHFFIEDEWNYQVLLEGQCPFCRVKKDISN
ncbi:hypothetical protein HDV01_001247 [Terramyces sp. JEL0728]|nr:hypothetical protein HDV01_001247 [Terramyces sp. JEL0728]